LTLLIAKPSSCHSLNHCPNEEQQKIANTLSTLDNLIEAQDQKITQLKQHKKGLMQQMFVSSEVGV
jgi:hypothetical protein